MDPDAPPTVVGQQVSGRRIFQLCQQPRGFTVLLPWSDQSIEEPIMFRKDLEPFGDEMPGLCSLYGPKELKCWMVHVPEDEDCLLTAIACHLLWRGEVVGAEVCHRIALPGVTKGSGFEKSLKRSWKLKACKGKGCATGGAKSAMGQVNEGTLGKVFAEFEKWHPIDKEAIVFEWGAGRGRSMIATPTLLGEAVTVVGLEQSPQMFSCGLLHLRQNLEAGLIPGGHVTLMTYDSARLYNFDGPTFITAYAGARGTKNDSPQFFENHNEVIIKSFMSQTALGVLDTKAVSKEHLRKIGISEAILKQWFAITCDRCKQEESGFQMILWIRLQKYAEECRKASLAQVKYRAAILEGPPQLEEKTILPMLINRAQATTESDHMLPNGDWQFDKGSPFPRPGVYKEVGVTQVSSGRHFPPWCELSRRRFKEPDSDDFLGLFCGLVVNKGVEEATLLLWDSVTNTIVELPSHEYFAISKLLADVPNQARTCVANFVPQTERRSIRTQERMALDAKATAEKEKKARVAAEKQASDDLANAEKVAKAAKAAKAKAAKETRAVAAGAAAKKKTTKQARAGKKATVRTGWMKFNKQHQSVARDHLKGSGQVPDLAKVAKYLGQEWNKLSKKQKLVWQEWNEPPLTPSGVGSRPQTSLATPPTGDPTPPTGPRKQLGSSLATPPTGGPTPPTPPTGPQKQLGLSLATPPPGGPMPPTPPTGDPDHREQLGPLTPSTGGPTPHTPAAGGGPMPPTPSTGDPDPRKQLGPLFESEKLGQSGSSAGGMLEEIRTFRKEFAPNVFFDHLEKTLATVGTLITKGRTPVPPDVPAGSNLESLLNKLVEGKVKEGTDQTTRLQEQLDQHILDQQEQQRKRKNKKKKKKDEAVAAAELVEKQRKKDKKHKKTEDKQQKKKAKKRKRQEEEAIARKDQANE